MKPDASPRTVILAVMLCAICACKKSRQDVQPTDCSKVTVSPANITVSALDATATLAVTIPAGCAWTATSQLVWAGISSGASGNGSGSVTIAVTGNSGGPRAGSITVATKVVPIAQDAAPSGCAYQLSPSGFSVGAVASVRTIQLITGSGCPWSYRSDLDWITVGPHAPGMAPTDAIGTPQAAGPQYLDVGVKATTESAPRQGTVTIAGQTLTVLQDGLAAAACTYSMTPPAASFPASGGTGTLTVTTGPNCSWSIDRMYDAEDWIPAVTSGWKIGPGSVSYTVKPNMDQARTGRLQLYGTQSAPLATHVVTQAGAGGPTAHWR